MPFQKGVQSDLAKAVQGDLYSFNPYSVTTKKAGSDVIVGYFVFYDADSDKVNARGTGEPLGVALRENTAINPDFKSEASLVILKGRNVPAATQGEVWVVTTTAAEAGQAVFADIDGGGIAAAAPGSTVAGFVETKFKVISEGSAGQLIGISSWV